ncbi:MULTISPECIES: morphogenic membrane protein MmpA [unclassified Streptomyces]|uniref:morphogenic membrane protein MmpA n=1 Tax=unclassified Streptomyces TaxID=2593676 RepID=UPI00381FD16A
MTTRRAPQLHAHPDRAADRGPRRPADHLVGRPDGRPVGGPVGAGLVLAVLAGAGWVVGMVYTLVVWPL